MSRNITLCAVQMVCLTFIVGAGVQSVRAQPHDPQADPKAVVLSGQARFTILTPELVRMEWSEDSTFEDQASLVFIHRRLPVPNYETRISNGWVEVETGKLRLRYKEGSGAFTRDNLEVKFRLNGRSVSWNPEMKDTASLGGTIRTLDGVEKPVPLEPGILSRDGWTVVNDSERPLFDTSPWPWVMPRRAGNRQDLYFFGYAHDYKKALFDFTTVAGKIPLPPRFAFGLWWSRYWAYTDQELKELVREFETFNVPLDVLVIDMDWHTTFNLRWDSGKRDQAGQRLGWTGYTWDKNYFPDPEGFLSWCEDKGLRTPLNVHPASGIQPHEEAYPAMARAMGIDPATETYVPFDIVDKRFAENYMNIILRPLEKQGVDFWWLDWQAWSTTKIAGVTPTWWLNYVFFTDMQRQGRNRPLLFHRWGGLGNHRYQIGFSGDAFSNWDVLGFETYFTSTASNVGFGYWSHDIGGHIPGPVSPEMYTRWVQFGVFSPILRTHTTKNALAERRIWGYPAEHFKAMRDAVALRYALIPYTYTAAREAYDTGISICRPMYYDWPEFPEAYSFKSQYMFGQDMMVSPISGPVDSLTYTAEKVIWLPPGAWYEWSSGLTLNGPQTVKRRFALDEIPVYVKAGAIIPLQPEMKSTHAKPVDPLILLIHPGDSGSCRVYEDAGNSDAYQRGEYAWTSVVHSPAADRSKQVEVLPVSGSYPGMIEQRACEIRLVNSLPPKSVRRKGGGIPYNSDGRQDTWSYDGERMTTVIRLGKTSVKKKIELIVMQQEFSANNSRYLVGVTGKLARLRQAMSVINSGWPKEWSPDELVNAVQTGNRMSLTPSAALPELSALDQKILNVLGQIGSLKLDDATARRAKSLIEQALPEGK